MNPEKLKIFFGKKVSCGQKEISVQSLSLKSGRLKALLFFDFAFPEGIPDCIKNGKETLDEAWGFAGLKFQEIKESFSELSIGSSLIDCVLTQYSVPARLTRFDEETGLQVLLTDAEIEKVLADLSKNPKNEWLVEFIREGRQAVQEGYFKFVPHIFPDECWKALRWGSIRLIVRAVVQESVLKSIVASS